MGKVIGNLRYKDISCISQSDNFKGTFYTGDEYNQATIAFGKFNEQNPGKAIGISGDGKWIYY
jgi:hypothetical protein